jgi:nickel-type superoxide dismutase maturation protease
MLRIIKVTGKSLWPEYQEGDYVVLTTFPFSFRSLKRGDVVVFRHPEYDTMIKKVEQTSPEQGTISVIGNHPNSIDSRQFGPIHKRDLIGKVFWHVPKPRR